MGMRTMGGTRAAGLRPAGKWARVAVIVAAGMAWPAAAFGQATAAPGDAAAGVTPGDTVWVLLAAALVMLMTPGLAFFYGGLVRKKNVLSILMQCFMLLCIISLQWVFFGYSLAFGPDFGQVIGNLDWVGLRGVGMEAGPYAPHIPHQLFAIFQMMFAVITPGLIAGAFAERMRFSAFCMFSLLWATLVYDPVAHWLWGQGGFMGTQGGFGAVDFAGGAVVHINAGMAALAAVIALRKRQGFPSQLSPPHSLPLAVLGAGLLWFGWYGFNAGSAVSSGGLAGTTFITTTIATAAAMLCWLLTERIRDGHATSLGGASGVVAGLVAITPACSSVNVVGALAIGATAGVLCALAVGLKFKFGFDDSLDVVGVHLVGGLVGTLMVGLVAAPEAPAAVAGLFYGGGTDQLWRQAVGAFAVLGYSAVVTAILALLLKHTIGLRLDREAEAAGVDEAEHAETAYDFAATGGGSGFSRHGAEV